MQYKGQYPPGVLVETRQGFPVPAGTIRFSRSARLYTDGSADHPGTGFATASCSVVEKAVGKPELAVQVALPPDWPQSAVAAEMYAILVVLHILARGDEFGEPHVAGSVTLVADCEAVCRAGRWTLPQLLHEKFVFASCWQGYLDGPVREICKVAAHRTRHDAQVEGWEADWVGNDTADELAKDARPSVVGHGRKWTREFRQAARLLETATAAVPAGFLSRAFGLGHVGRVGKAPRGPRPPVTRHTVAFVAGRWACSTCGAACRKPSAVAAFREAECAGGRRLLDNIHFSHRLQVGWLGQEGLVPGARGQLPFAICTACGYFSSSRVVGLARVCTRHVTAGRRGGIARAARGLHPVKAVSEVVLGLKAASGGAGGPEPGGPPEAQWSCGTGASLGLSSIADGAARAACKRVFQFDRPPAIPSLVCEPCFSRAGDRTSLGGSDTMCEGWQAAEPSAVGGPGEGWQAAGPFAEEGSFGSGTAPATGVRERRPPASQTSPAERPRYSPGVAEGSWDPFDGIGFDFAASPGHGVGLGASAEPCMWCDFCGLPFQRSVRVGAARLSDDTVSGSTGAVCVCGEGFA